MCLVAVFQCALSLLMLCGSDMWVLINYMSFVQWLSVGGSIAGMIYLRVTQPDRPRPIKVGPTARQAPPHEGRRHYQTRPAPSR